MTFSERENYCAEDPTTHEHNAPSSKDSENTLLEECGNTFSIHDSIFAGKLEEGTRQALTEEKMWCYRASYRDDPIWENYAGSYKDAADHLVGNIERYEVDSLVYPIMFLYRHHLELQLKSLLRNFYLLHGIQCSCHQKTHDLVELWHRVRPRIEKMYPQDTEDNDHIEARIKEFDLIDTKSFAFRYPKDKKGNPSFESVPKRCRDYDYINLFQVRCIVEDMHKKLDGTNEHLCVRLQEAAYWIPPSGNDVDGGGCDATEASDARG